MNKKLFYRSLTSVFLAAFCLMAAGQETLFAAAEVALSGDVSRGSLTADNNGRYQFVNVPLRRNAVNRFTVTARNGDLVQSREVLITQLSLDSVVVSKIKSEPLSVQEIEKLVNDGVIDIQDPANFNVSRFQIVLTIGNRQVPIDVPIVTPIEEPIGFEIIKPQNDPGSGRSNARPPEIVVFELKPPPSHPDQPPAPPIPGVLIIEGRIKTLKEFYSVRLLLMNTSGIFTLHDVTANIEFPDGGLSNTLPLDGIIQYGDILPGDAETPGQKEREFIIRGDEIGVRGVKVNFGGTVIGPGIPEDAPIPFNGSASTSVEVKGPPEFRVQVIHPPSVTEGVPYEFLVDITNVGDTPALYTSFELDVGADGELVECMIAENGEPECLPLEGAAHRSIGHLLPGETTRQSFTINPFVTGDITSCMSISDQNIDLQVHVGAIGCLTGKRPPSTGTPDGLPAMTVLPIANSFGLSIETPVTAFFNKFMNTSTITTGENGTFNVFTSNGARVQGQLRFAQLFEQTVAIWQPLLGPLAGNTTYRVEISDSIADLQGFTLKSPWTSEFTTTDPRNDITPPTLTLSVEPPVNPNLVLPGQIIRLNAYAADQGTGVSRIELRMMDTSTPNAVFELIDQKTIFADVSGPVIFSVDSASLVAGRTYQFKATALDHAGNIQDSTLAVIIAELAAPPTIQLPADPANPVLQGISVTLVPTNISPSTRQVDYFLNGAAQPFKTVMIAPFSATLGTLNLPLQTHTIRAVAVDGLGQTGEDTFSFVLANNPSEPVVKIESIVSGAQYVTGTPVLVKGNATDPLGIQSVAFFLNNPAGAPVATGTEAFSIDTATLPLGTHELFLKATNKLGVSNDLSKPASRVTFEVIEEPPPAPPPAAPVITEVSFPVNGLVTVKGTGIAGGRLDVMNLTQGFQAGFFVDELGFFQFAIEANAGDLLRLTVLKFSQSPSPSAPADVVVPAAPVLTHLTLNPTARTFNASNQFQDIEVTGHYEGGATANLTQQAVFNSSNTAIATVNASGRVVPQANGDALITVSAGGKQAQMNVTVDIITLTSIALTPSEFTLFGVGKTQQLSVVGTYSNGSTGPISAGLAAFSSSAPGKALINAQGLVTAVDFGTAVMTATVSGVPPAQSQITIAPVAAASISVSPNVILFTAEDETRQLAVTVNFNDGSTGAPGGVETYASSDDSIVTVDENGLVTAKANGDATVTVSYESFSATVTIVVDIPVATEPPPEILSLDRQKAGEGDIFAILGKNFSPVPAHNLVKVNGIAAQVLTARQDELSVIVPPGATTGSVTVEVQGQISNSISLVIYGRRAESVIITPAVNMAAGAGAKLNLPGPAVDFRAGDKAYLSSAPDILAPLDFDGILRARIDGGAFFEIPASLSAIDITSHVTPGTRVIDLELQESGGLFRTQQIWLISGPNNTGAIAGVRSVMANSQTRPTAVTFINLTGLDGNPYPDGSKVVVTAQAHCFRDRTTGGCIPSHGGSIINGEGDGPEGFGFRIFTVQNGRIDVVYDPVSAPGLIARELATANIYVLPAQPSGHRIGNTALAYSPVILTSFDTVGATRSQTSTIADGLEKTITVKFTGARDSAGVLVPDGTPFLVTTEFHCFRDPVTSACIGSAGGKIQSGSAAPEGFGLRQHFIQNGEVSVQYSPGNVLLAFPSEATANIQFLPSRPSGHRIGDRAFQITPILLSSPRSATLTFPSSVFADGADNRILISVTDFKDAQGAPVPDGTRVAVTAQEHCFRDPVTNGCIGSAGGVIKSGTPGPEGFGLTIHEVQGGAIEIIYSSEGVLMPTRASAGVAVQILPARPSGHRIGDRAFAVARFSANGYQTATVSASPSAVVADGLSKTVNLTFSNIRDTAGNVVPDGSKVLLTAQAHCFRHPDTNGCVGSQGGVITSGNVAPEGFGFQIHTVVGGQIQATYDPGSVTLPVPETAIANIQALPSRPSGHRIGDRAFAILPVTLSSLTEAQVDISPASVLADGAVNLTTVTISEIKDGAGNAVPNGTKIVATPENQCFRHPVTNGCVNSAGGTITSGIAGPEGFGLRVHEVTGGTTTLTYDSAPIRLDSRDSTTANIQVMPAQPSGHRIGNRAFLLAPVTLAGYQSADISGPGQIAPNNQGTYIVSNIRDTSGQLIPDGSKIAVSPENHCFRNPDTNGCISSIGGSVTNGEASPEGLGLRIFTVTGGQISVNYRAPASTGVAVLQLLPARPSGHRNGHRAFAVKSVSVQS